MKLQLENAQRIANNFTNLAASGANFGGSMDRARRHFQELMASPDPLVAALAAERDFLCTFIERQSVPVHKKSDKSTAAALARRLEVSVQVMRRHLRTLEEEGLVRSSLSAAGPGRPSNQWHLTAQGQGRFPGGSEDFALGLLQSMTESLSEETVNLLLSQQGTQKAQSYRRHVGAGSLQERLERLVDLRRQEGYVAECCPDPDGHSWVIQEFHCSVMRIAEQFPCVCDQELRLIRETFPDCVVERVQWRLEAGHSCGFRLQPVLAS